MDTKRSNLTYFILYLNAYNLIPQETVEQKIEEFKTLPDEEINKIYESLLKIGFNDEIFEEIIQVVEEIEEIEEIDI